MEMLFSCPRCTGGAHLASQNQLFGSLAENGRFLNKPLIWKCYFLVPAALVGGAHLASQNQLFGSLAENGRQGRAGQGQGRARAGPGQGNGSRPCGVPPQTPNTDQKDANGRGFGVLIITD